jgi:ribosomal protein S1
LTDFGAFVELEPGIEGLVHVSHIAKEHVEKPADVLRVNEVVEVKILEYVSDEKKVKLSMKEVHAADEVIEAVEEVVETEE